MSQDGRYAARITPAMIERCRQLAQPGAELMRTQPPATTWSTLLTLGGPEIAADMVRRMDAAGLIAWTAAPTAYAPRAQRAVLTPAGLDAIARADRAALRRRAMEIDPRTP